VISVLVVDDHPATRVGLRALLESDGEFSVVGEAGSAAEAVTAAAATDPDLVLLDVRMQGGDGVSVIPRIRKAAHPVRIVCLSAFDEVPLIDGALRGGADGFLVKGLEPDELIASLRRAAAGEVVIPAEIAERLEPFRHRREGSTFVLPLSDRERAVLRLASRGLTNPEIGDQLYMSESTVKLHLRRALEKLDAPDRTAAVAAAIRRGLIE
jgi:DNA-binding NarL/FixJ family response regulator